MWRIFWASARHEWQRLWGDRWDRAMIGIVPLLTVLLVWWIFSAGLATRLPVGVLDQDHSTLSRQAVRFLQASQGLEVQAHFTSMAQAEAALRSGGVDALVLLPADLARNVKTSRPASVALIHNAQWSMPSGLIQRDVRNAIGALSAGIEINIRNKRGQDLRHARDTFSPIRSQMTGLFNVSSNYQMFLATNLMPALLHILAMTAGAWAIGRKLRDRTVDEWLQQSILADALEASGGRAARPALRWRSVLAAMLGKTVWTMLGMMAAASVAFALMTTRLHAPFLSWVATWSGLYLLVLLSVAMGMLAAAVTLSLRMALSMTGFITAPAFAFSGVGYPLLAMPAGAYAWAQMLPLTHYLQLQVGMLQMQAPLPYAVLTLAGLALATVVVLALAAWGVQRAYARPERWGAR